MLRTALVIRSQRFQSLDKDQRFTGLHSQPLDNLAQTQWPRCEAAKLNRETPSSDPDRSTVLGIGSWPATLETEKTELYHSEATWETLVYKVGRYHA